MARFGQFASEGWWSVGYGDPPFRGQKGPRGPCSCTRARAWPRTCPSACVTRPSACVRVMRAHASCVAARRTCVTRPSASCVAVRHAPGCVTLTNSDPLTTHLTHNINDHNHLRLDLTYSTRISSHINHEFEPLVTPTHRRFSLETHCDLDFDCDLEWISFMISNLFSIVTHSIATTCKKSMNKFSKTCVQDLDP